MPEQVYPGSRAVADRLHRDLAAGRVGQPYLFVGPDGCGKEVTALEIARLAQCRRPQTCRRGALCESCQKAVTFQHPDIRWIGPAPAALEDAKKSPEVREIFAAKIEDAFYRPDFAASSQILIGNPDQPGPLTVRGLLQFLRRQAFQSPWKIAVVADANRLNLAAANALLKTLEEPPPRAIIMLLVPSLAGVLPTILSRCQQVSFTAYSAAELETLLADLHPEADAAVRAEAARLADGNIRKALGLLDADSQALRRWVETLFDALADRRSDRAVLAAEQLHTGTGPGLPGGGHDLAARRQRALQVCETLALLLAETVACRERGPHWQPRATAAAALVRRAAAQWDTDGLLRAIARVEQAKQDIDGNFNLGLVMAVLLQDLSVHA